jgi:hypothetical protein
VSTCASQPIPSTQIPDPSFSAAKPQHPRSEQIAQALATTLLYIFPALICLRFSSADDLDIWWHLRTGQWIVQHHAIPHADLFSSATMGKPWEAYSWLFALLNFHLFHRLGLSGIVVYTTGMVFAITIALHHLIKRLQQDFTLTVALTGWLCLTMFPLYTPRPWLFTILFTVLELDILMHARKTGRLRELLWFPIIFALWANLHIQFIDGLIILAIALAESLLTSRSTSNSTRIPLRPLVLTLAASLLATLLNPYGWHIYKTAHDLAVQPGALHIVTELQSMSFRSISDFSVLFVAFACVAMLARSRRFLPFETALFLFAAIVSFRSQRDLWVVTVTGAAILASTITNRKTPRRLPAFSSFLFATIAGVVLFLASFVAHINNATLNTELSKTLPVRAVAVAKARNYQGPVYNNYNWGGYLIWELRLPVSIDGRAGLHGDERIHRSQITWTGEPGWATDPQLNSAGFVIAPVKSPLTQLLRSDPDFKLTYEDQLAALFIPVKPQQTSTIVPPNLLPSAIK